MKALIIYIAIFIFLLFAFFVEKKKTVFVSLEGASYDVYADTRTVIPERPTETILFNAPSSNIYLPSLNIFAELQLPEKFIARIVSKKSEANYALVSTTQTQMQTNDLNITAPRSGKPKKIKTGKKSGQQQIQSVPVEIKETNNFFTLNNIVKNSDKTYFFSQKEKTKEDVTVRVYSITPWKDKDILKFQVINNQKEFFFISNTSLYEQKQLIFADYFYELLVGPEKTLDCIALLPRQKQKQLTIKLIESGRKNRNFLVDFNTP